MLWQVTRPAVVLISPSPGGWVSAFDAARLPTILGRRLFQQQQQQQQEQCDCDPCEKRSPMLMWLLLSAEAELMQMLVEQLAARRTG